jgi:hypothetical protein
MGNSFRNGQYTYDQLVNSDYEYMEWLGRKLGVPLERPILVNWILQPLMCRATVQSVDLKKNQKAATFNENER